MRRPLTQLVVGLFALTIGTQNIGGSIAKTIEKSYEDKRIDDSLYAANQKPKTPEPNIIFIDRLEAIVDSLSHASPIPELIHKNYILDFIHVESEDDASKVSWVGASGLMQLMPTAWSEVMPDSLPYYPNVFNPELNIAAGRLYLSKLYHSLKKEYSGWNELTDQHKLDLISAAYNAGLTSLSDKDFSILSMPYETRNHIRKINTLLDSNYVFDYYKDSDTAIFIGDSLNQDFPKRYTLVYDTSKVAQDTSSSVRKDSTLVYTALSSKDSSIVP